MTPRRVIGIGASTGGVEALLMLLSAFPADCPPTLIVQHMQAEFVVAFAERLDRNCAARVRIAEDAAVLAPGCIFVAPCGDAHLTLARHGNLQCRLTVGDKVASHRPSVDVLFASLAFLGPAATGILLTGMGRDGAQGLLKMRQAGAATIAQDSASSTVYGMPRAAAEIGACRMQLPLSQIAPALFGPMPAAAKGSAAP